MAASNEISSWFCSLTLFVPGSIDKGTRVPKFTLEQHYEWKKEVVGEKESGRERQGEGEKERGEEMGEKNNLCMQGKQKWCISALHSSEEIYLLSSQYTVLQQQHNNNSNSNSEEIYL